jgi:RimJ/RimL family protein N-acetyltransferase
MVHLTADEITLRTLLVNDASPIATLANNRKIWNNLRDTMPHPYSLQDALNFIAICENEDPVLTFAIEYNGELAGVIGLVKQYDVYRLNAELGFWLGEPFWNKGIVTKAVELIVKYGFENLDIIRIYACVFDFNIASRRVLDKSGFKFDALFKNAIIKNNQIGNECRYSILKP